MSGFIAPSGPAYAVPGGFGVGQGAAARCYLEGTADPSAGAGVVAPVGSLYCRNNAGNGEAWQKTGAANAAWAIVGGGGAAAQPSVRVGLAVAIPHASGGQITDLLFDTVLDDPLGMWDAANAQVVVPVAGLYLVQLALHIEVITVAIAGRRSTDTFIQRAGDTIYVASTEWLAVTPASIGDYITLHATSTVVRLPAGDNLRVTADMANANGGDSWVVGPEGWALCNTFAVTRLSA